MWICFEAIFASQIDEHQCHSRKMDDGHLVCVVPPDIQLWSSECYPTDSRFALYRIYQLEK